MLQIVIGQGLATAVSVVRFYAVGQPRALFLAISWIIR
jgi:hypothetical protein